MSSLQQGNFMHYDVFNGDADGICSLHQLRLDHPIPAARLITGVKRDISLLSRSGLADIRECSLTVLDISLDSNATALADLLQRKNTICYFDHHSAHAIPASSNLQPHIHCSPDTCTSLIVNTCLKGKHAVWAICGAFGDNLHRQGLKVAADLHLQPEEINKSREVGELLNYNGYGTDLADLHFHPADLYKDVSGFRNPIDYYHASPCLPVLRQGYTNDMEAALSQKELRSTGRNGNRIYIFPNAPWARRVAGVFSNLKARERTDAAHALITENTDATLRVSVRAPLAEPKNADVLCRKFPTGGGRAGAAGINSLPADMLDNFLAAFTGTYP
jgi:hypothetical protein